MTKQLALELVVILSRCAVSQLRDQCRDRDRASLLRGVSDNDVQFVGSQPTQPRNRHVDIIRRQSDGSAQYGDGGPMDTSALAAPGDKGADPWTSRCEARVVNPEAFLTLLPFKSDSRSSDLK